MARRLAIFVSLLVAALLGGAGTLLAADPAAQAFVEGIYAHYRGPTAQASGVVLNNDAALTHYFTPSLTALIIKDRDEADRRGEVPALDGDPFVGAQEWQIERFDIALRDIDNGHAGATVRFVNFGNPATVRLELVRIGGAWRIDDIHWNGESLRGLLSGK